jgi:ribonuclease R
MFALASLLRKRRGSLDLPRGQTEFVFDAAGHVVDLRSIAKDDAHWVIEEFMLAANRQVARLMLQRRQPTPFRHHPAPDDLSHVWETLEALGVRPPADGSLAGAVGKAVDAGFGPAITSALFRCMPRARYTTAEPSHFTLGFEAYCHFTSPIRRYTDLLVHRQIHSLLDDTRNSLSLAPAAAASEPRRDDALEALCERLNARSFAADRAESRIRRQRVLEFVLRQGAVPTTGQVTAVLEKGLLIDLTEYGTSGFLAVEDLPGGPHEFSAGTLTAKRSTYRLGQDLEVCVSRIDPVAGRLDLALAPTY